jgi:hypothetical protein
MRKTYGPRNPLFIDGDPGQEIQPSKDQTAHVLLGKGFSPKLRMHATQPVQTSRSRAKPAEVGNRKPIPRAHDHISHLSLSVDEQGDLSFDFSGYGRELSGQFRGYDLGGRDPATIQMLEPFVLTGLEAAGFSKYLVDGSSLPAGFRLGVRTIAIGYRLHPCKGEIE